MNCARSERFVLLGFSLAFARVVVPLALQAQSVETSGASLRFQITFPSSVSASPHTGRMFLAISRRDTAEPRLRVGRYGVQLLGVDFERLHPGSPVTIDGSTLGYPIKRLPELSPGDYMVQAILNNYAEFKRADGHTVWMHMDQWEVQDWRRSPGNVVSDKWYTIPITNTRSPSNHGGSCFAECTTRIGCEKLEVLAVRLIPENTANPNT